MGNFIVYVRFEVEAESQAEADQTIIDELGWVQSESVQGSEVLDGENYTIIKRPSVEEEAKQNFQDQKRNRD